MTFTRFDLPMFDFDRRRPAENVDHYRDAAVRLIDRVYVAFKVLKVTFLHAHSVTVLNGMAVFRSLPFFLGQNLARPQDALDILAAPWASACRPNR